METSIQYAPANSKIMLEAQTEDFENVNQIPSTIILSTLNSPNNYSGTSAHFLAETL